MTYVLAVDTETTGLVVNQEPPGSPRQPHLVQLGALLLTEQGSIVQSVDLIVSPMGKYEIPEQAARVHGITTEVAEAAGVPLALAVACYTNLRARADRIIAHNWRFDQVVLETAVHRTGRRPAHPGPANWTCTMELATPLMQLPPTERMRAAGFDKYKPPNLGELYQFLFNEPLLGAHGAFADAQACARVYFELKRRETAEERTEG